ncbi:sigma-54-dependent Fis family transcriptional regulator [Noviherbaspirillum cavernae]|uniref:Sigma-54-dependent Fis family transcriptional regulator n=1 Tax=Noviherbaspirillum cavernae TaxID=2320862 RepID=A0A418X2Q0_9BURK|nr:sigma-54 dependent transcriptional regulator [Noviherbaspirillum cavernae]RJG06726.1 sigma-54-dependent Fis family transcriptional regulator [Noviherbaspirillum cavernae]
MAFEKSIKRFDLMYGSSPAMERLFQQIEKVAATDATVLLVGESGTGKELIAKAIHQASPRNAEAFVAVNCGAIPAHLIEAALFGHEKGSFTGAARQHVGYFEHASRGTLFLDEITEMPVEMQVKLLRVLESGAFLRVGGSEEVKVDVRLVAATNRDLEGAVKQGHLREDLMYRLAVFPVRVPPLRERGIDIELLAQCFLHELNAQEKTDKVFSHSSLEVVRSYSWPGNVRELKNVVQRAFIIATDTLNIEECLSDMSAKKPTFHEGYLNFFVGTPLAEAQREIILATLKHYSGNKRLTAEALGISLKTLYNRLKDY